MFGRYTKPNSSTDGLTNEIQWWWLAINSIKYGELTNKKKFCTCSVMSSVDHCFVINFSLNNYDAINTCQYYILKTIQLWRAFLVSTNKCHPLYNSFTIFATLAVILCLRSSPFFTFRDKNLSGSCERHTFARLVHYRTRTEFYSLEVNNVGVIKSQQEDRKSVV